MKTRILATVIFLALGATTAMAGIAAGPPFGGDSWGQQWVETGIGGTFDTIGVRMIVGTLEHPSFSGFNPSSWSLRYEDNPTSPTVAVMFSPTPTNYLYWNWLWAGDQSQTLTFDYVCYGAAGDVQWAQHSTWIPGSGWDYGHFPPYGPTVNYWNPGRDYLLGLSVVPAPAAVLLGVIGLGLVGWVKRRLA